MLGIRHKFYNYLILILNELQFNQPQHYLIHRLPKLC